MRITEVLSKRKFVRMPLTPAEIKMVPFRELLPLQLKNSVSGRSERTADVSCLQEMAVMFACMKKHDFKEVKCTEEIDIFQKCYAEYTGKKKMRKVREESGQMITGTNSRNLTTKQMNKLLSKHPQFNESK